jgi:hypothetical protein
MANIFYGAALLVTLIITVGELLESKYFVLEARVLDFVVGFLFPLDCYAVLILFGIPLTDKICRSANHFFCRSFDSTNFNFEVKYTFCIHQDEGSLPFVRYKQLDPERERPGRDLNPGRESDT